MLFLYLHLMKNYFLMIVLDMFVVGEAEYSHSFLMYPSLNMASRKTISLNGERSRTTPWP